MTDLKDLEYGVFDLYDKVILLLKNFSVSGPATIALTKAIQEYDPQLAKLYAKHFAAAEQLKQFQDLAEMLPVLEKAVQTLKNRAG